MAAFPELDFVNEKRTPRCFPKKLNLIKNGLFGKDFPSKVKVASESPGVSFEDSLRSSTPIASQKSGLCKPAIKYWRIANCSDVNDIIDLIEKSDHIVDEMFNQPDVLDLIEKSSFAIVQFNSNEELVSFSCAFSYPNIPVVPSFEWFIWIDRAYHIDDVSPRNTLFIHYMVWRPDYYEEFLILTLETMFMGFPFLKNIIIVKPPLVKLPELFSHYFIPALPKDIHEYKWDSNSVQTLWLCLRHSLLQRLKIRPAIMEDHDDLMPIIEKQTTKLRELYGDFCMAEIIEFPGTEDRKTLVCEVSGYAVAFMNLNRAIDLDLLNMQFDLGVFNGLRKPTEEDKYAEIFEDVREKTVYLPQTFSPSLDIINSEIMANVKNWVPTICKSKEDGETEKSEDSFDNNDLTTSMVDLIKEAVEAKIVPKFSAHALAPVSSDTMDICYEEFSGESSHIIKTELSLMSLQYYNLPEYHGPQNAFCIELFAVHEDFNENLCSDFLEAAFELFPDLEYCLLTVPSQCQTFPLLDLFVRVTPRPLKRFKQELYVCHKSSVMITFMRVRRALKSDLDEIYILLKGIKNREFIYADIANSCINPDSAYQGFVLICSTAIVGVAVICNENGLEYLTEHYHVAEFIDFELHKMDYHAVLKHLTLSPIYQTHARFFLRDIMRMADITALYRARYEERQGAFNTTSLITVLGQLVPVKPRRMIKYHQPTLGNNVPPPYLLNYDEPFALFHINSRICGQSKFSSNINLVIVGSSRTAFSFLENLLYAPNSAYVTYNNITWVSPHGTGSELAAHPARDLMFPYEGKYNRRYTSQISLHSFVNIVYGVMTLINRTDKYIMINNDAIIRYDYLILLCGRQYLLPVPFAHESDAPRCLRGSRQRCSLFKYLVNQKEKPSEKEPVFPSNVLLINTVFDATSAIITIQYLLKKRKNMETNEKIIIYGQDLTVYFCTQSLLKFGVPPEVLAIVEPPSKNFSSEKVFMDPNVDAAMTETLSRLNISHYRDYVLYDWTICDNNQLGTITFHSNHHKVTLRCMAFLPFEEKLVSDVTFNAVNEASLVYDGRLVINHRFQTNDPFIYAAGSFTKYQRKYHANDKRHEFYDSSEVGKLLAEIIRAEIDPTEQNEENNEKSEEEVLPNFKSPVLVSGQLPGDWNYFHLRKPGKLVPLEVQCNIKEYGDSLITGDCQMSNGYGYFRLHLDDYGFVTTITCFTKDEIDVENLPMLYGKHEKYLNNLLLRFNSGLISDFYSYFRERWVYALYHDQFKHVMKANEEMFELEEAPGKQRIIDMIDDALKDKIGVMPEEETLSLIKEMYEISEVKENIVKILWDYLTQYDSAFPMYATSGILRILLHESSSSFLHRSSLRGSNAGQYSTSIHISDPRFNY